MGSWCGPIAKFVVLSEYIQRFEHSILDQHAGDLRALDTRRALTYPPGPQHPDMLNHASRDRDVVAPTDAVLASSWEVAHKVTHSFSASLIL